VVMDLGPYLRRGENAIIFTSTGGLKGGGGPLMIHIGTGSTKSGTLVLDSPELTLTRVPEAASQRLNKAFELIIE